MGVLIWEDSASYPPADAYLDPADFLKVFCIRIPDSESPPTPSENEAVSITK